MKTDPRAGNDLDERLEADGRRAGSGPSRSSRAGELLGGLWRDWGLRLAFAGGMVAMVALVVGGLVVVRDGRFPWQPRPAPTALATAPATVPAIAPTPAPTPTGAVAATSPTAAPALATATLAPVAPAPSPTASPVRTTPTATGPTPTLDPQIGLGRHPLPPGVDLSDGPLLRELAKKSNHVAHADDGKLGSQLVTLFNGATDVDAIDIMRGDDSRLELYFTGRALEERRRWVERVRQDSRPFTTRVVTEHRVMRTILGNQGDGENAYLIADAATERTERIKPWRQGQGEDIEVLSVSEPTRKCYTWLVVPVNGTWRLEHQQHGDAGENGAHCPPGWV
jgi:hypothetical protein